MPHRAPGAPGHKANYLSGKVIKYYRPRGSAEVRQLIATLGLPIYSESPATAGPASPDQGSAAVDGDLRQLSIPE